MKGGAVAPPLPRTDGVIVVAVTPTSAAAATDSSAATAAVDDDVMKAMMMDVVLLPPPPFILSFHQQDVVNVLEITDITPQLKDEMRMATKSPSEWLRFLCSNWSIENEAIVAATDVLYLQYKSYLKGRLTSQLLCRLSVFLGSDNSEVEMASSLLSPCSSSSSSINFWKILGVEDEFDRAHIHASVERFFLVYDILGIMSATTMKLTDNGLGNSHVTSNNGDRTASHISTRNNSPSLEGTAVVIKHLTTDRDNNVNYGMPNIPRLEGADFDGGLSTAANRRPRPNPTHLSSSSRDERRARKADMSRLCKGFAQKRTEEALRRAAELVSSNCIPVDIITKGASGSVVSSIANAGMIHLDTGSPDPAASSFTPSSSPTSSGTSALDNMNLPTTTTTTTTIGQKKGRSSIVISTASDLDQIVTHSNNLWVKYKAIAKSHNVKVNWNVVAKDLGIHVKVREKCARMHARACSRGFDFANWGHYRIKDYPQFFLDPLEPNLVDVKMMSAVEAPLPANAYDVPANVVDGMGLPAVIERMVVNHGQQEPQHEPMEGSDMHVIPPLPPSTGGNTARRLYKCDWYICFVLMVSICTKRILMSIEL